jgi:hypothetical protein
MNDEIIKEPVNLQVREYLINVARQKDRIVYYSDVVKDCKLNINLDTESGRYQLSNILGKVSEFEDRDTPSRPLLSSLAVYKSGNDHGDGFYRIAELLGKGRFKELKKRLWGYEEANRCREFWQQSNNYKQYASIVEGKDISFKKEFFNMDELIFFKSWQKRAYDPKNDEHRYAKEYLLETVWDKSVYLGEEIVRRLNEFDLGGKKYWSQRGWAKNEQGKSVRTSIIKPYTWVKVFRHTDKEKDIFFTFGVEANHSSFIYKLDYQRNQKTRLSQMQQNLCNSLIPEKAKWNTISFENLVDMNWNTLIEVCVLFIQDQMRYYDAVIEAVWNNKIPPAVFKDKLIQREKPLDGFNSIPKRKLSFNGVDINFPERQKEQKILGDAGEELVKLNEIEFLKGKGLYDKAQNVEIVKDGNGYDIHSFDEYGNDKFIEVKTTTDDAKTVFFLSENEVNFMRLHSNQYSIYRLYNFNKVDNSAEYYELKVGIEEQLLLEPIQYRVYLRRMDS